MVFTRPFFILAFLCLPGLLQSDPTDSLQLEIDTATPSEKIDILLTIASEALARGNTPTAEAALRRSIVLATRLADTDKIAKAQFLQARLFEQRFDDKNALKNYFEYLNKINAEGQPRSAAGAYLAIGKIYYKKALLTRSKQYFYKILKTVSESEAAAEAHRYLGKINLEENTLGTAQDHFSKAIEAKIAHGHLAAAAAVAVEFAEALSSLGQYEAAIAYTRMALDMHRSNENAGRMAADFVQLTKIYLARGYFEDALINNQQAQQLNLKRPDTALTAQIHLHFFDILHALGQNREATPHLRLVENELAKMPASSFATAMWQKLSERYAALRQPTAAYHALKQLVAMDAIVRKNRREKEMMELTTRYESETKAMEQSKEIALLKEEMAAAHRLKGILLAAALCCLAALAGIFVAFRRGKAINRILKEKNSTEKVQKAMLETQNKNLEILNQQLLHEIAERENLEKQSIEKDDFLAAMSARMSNPLNDITATTHLLMDHIENKEHKNHLKEIQFATNHLMVFINDILDFSKIESGRLRLKSVPFSPKKLLSDLSVHFEKEAARHQLSIKAQIARHIPGRLKGDPARLNQILHNLTAACLQLAHPGGAVNIHFKEADQSEDHYLLFIGFDYLGSPVSQDIYNSVFHPLNTKTVFEQERSMVFSLRVVQRLIELQNGKFEIENKGDTGSQFHCWIPIKKAATVAKPEIPDAILKEKLKYQKMLVVEDNRINRQVVRQLLQKYGVETVAVSNGKEALEKIEVHTFDLIIMDIQMPVLDGYKTTAIIRKMDDPVKRATPILALTASAYLSNEEKARLFGMDEYIGKPFHPDELFQKIMRCLRVGQ